MEDPTPLWIHQFCRKRVIGRQAHPLREMRRFRRAHSWLKSCSWLRGKLFLTWKTCLGLRIWAYDLLSSWWMIHFAPRCKNHDLHKAHIEGLVFSQVVKPMPKDLTHSEWRAHVYLRPHWKARLVSSGCAHDLLRVLGVLSSFKWASSYFLSNKIILHKEFQ